MLPLPLPLYSVLVLPLCLLPFLPYSYPLDPAPLIILLKPNPVLIPLSCTYPSPWCLHFPLLLPLFPLPIFPLPVSFRRPVSVSWPLSYFLALTLSLTHLSPCLFPLSASPIIPFPCFLNFPLVALISSLPLTYPSCGSFFFYNLFVFALIGSSLLIKTIIIIKLLQNVLK